MEITDAIRPHGDGVTLTLLITPRSGRDEIVAAGDALRVRIRAAPVDGRANDALLTFLAKRLGLPRSALTLMSGAASRRKIVHASGVTVEQAQERLLPATR